MKSYIVIIQRNAPVVLIFKVYKMITELLSSGLLWESDQSIKTCMYLKTEIWAFLEVKGLSSQEATV